MASNATCTATRKCAQCTTRDARILRMKPTRGRKNTTQSAAAKRADNRATRNQEAMIYCMTKHNKGRHITHVADDAAHASMKLRARGIAHVRKWGMKGKHGAAQSKTKGLRHHQRSSKSGKTTFSRSDHLLAAHLNLLLKIFYSLPSYN